MIALDGSRSMKRMDFVIARDDFLLALIRQLRAGADKSRVGMLVFSNKVKNAFWMNDHQTQKEVVTAIHRENRIFGMTNIAKVCM